MEDLIKTQLKPTDTCIVCTEPFSDSHHPVALPCRHIFGYECIKNWLRSGRGNTNSCPFCRHAIFEQMTDASFSPSSLWRRLCEQPPESLHDFMLSMWTGIQKLWKRRLNNDIPLTVTESLDGVVFPALCQSATSGPELFLDCYSLTSASWESLGRPDGAQGVAVPLVRLARLMSQGSRVLPMWLSTVERANILFWKANATLGLTEENVSWSHITEAARLRDDRYFPLLHLFTVLISQTIVHTEQKVPWPNRRHEIMNLVVERCCRIIGRDWSGRASNELKDILVVVYEELRRYQLKRRNKSLRGHDGEEQIVRGIWGMAGWKVTCS